MTTRERLPNRRASETFELECNGLRYRATDARDAVIALSLALLHGADVEVLRRALRRDGQGRANGPLGQALDFIAGYGQ